VPLPRKLVRFHLLPAETGVAVTGVEEDGPAKRAGLREGDVMVALDGRTVEGIDDLHRALPEGRIGKEATLTVIRGTEKLSVLVTPEELRVPEE
jgi:S1-C subfamily serine protease